MEWGVAKNLVCLWLLPVVGAAFFFAQYRKRSHLRRFGEPELVARLAGSLNLRARLLKKALVLAALALVVLALGQPHIRKKETRVERRGIDVMIAIDVSPSMLAKDIAPNRLEKAKLELAALIDRLKNDRIGIVAFSGDAVIQCPLTLDKDAAKLFLSTANPNLIPFQGTAIGQAILAGMQAFAEKEKEHKAMVLLTDGEDHEDDPMKAARRAKDSGIRIFTIGIGTPEGSTLPPEYGQGGYKKDRSGQAVLSKLNEPLLKEIAAYTGGAYYRSSRGELEIDRLVRELGQMAKKSQKSDFAVEYEENYQIPLLAAFLLLLFEMAVSERKSQRRQRREEIFAAACLAAALPFVLGFNFLSVFKNERGNRFYKKGQIEKAKSAYLGALKSSPDSPEIVYNLGNAYYKGGAMNESLNSYQAAAKSWKDSQLQSKAFYNLGNSQFRRGQTDQAAASYKEALKLNPKDEDAKYNLELLLRRQSQKKEDKKDQNKQNEQNQDQKENQQGSGGQGRQGGQNQSGGSSGQDQEGRQGQQGEDKQENQEKGQDQKESGAEGDKQQGESEKKEGSGEKQQAGGQSQQSREEEGQEKEADQKQGDAQSGEGESQEEGDGQSETQQLSGGGKSQAEIRAEQILNALENQERQVLKFQSGQGNPRAKVRRAAEKDW